MHSFPRFLLIGVGAFALAAPAASQRADDQILPKSAELQRQARELVAAGKLEQAEDLLETALAVDPRNRGAFVDIARVAEKQHLFGKAIRMTNKALHRARPGEPPEAANHLQGRLPADCAAFGSDQPWPYRGCRQGTGKPEV